MTIRRLTPTEADFARIITKAYKGGIITQSQRVAVYRMIKNDGLDHAKFSLIRAIDINKARTF